MISADDSIIILLSFGTLLISYSAMDGCTAINLVKHVKIVFFQVGVVCIDGICGSFDNSNNSCICTALCTMTAQTQNLVEDSFDMLNIYTKMGAEQPRPMYHLKEKICYHPLIAVSWLSFQFWEI